jgi:WD repeat and SOF domain-containing protein 1
MNILLTLALDRVLSCLYTSDSRFVLSGSDDGNVRMWKAKPNDRLGVLDGRERNALEYREALKERWKFDKEISRIQRYVIVCLHTAEQK